MPIRTMIAALLLVSTLGAARAQDPAEPTSAEMLQALNMTVAIVEFCGIKVSKEAALNIAAAGKMLEIDLGLTRDEADRRYIDLKATMIGNPPDCENGIDAIRALIQDKS